ncbi:hypothetical protein JRQ81_009441 [Phrynocephalus forsythii]|uniref:Cystatin domain-containing protein n=1 Tax=Phrynocephalus forsythii TaxID=171643 RepID=A0A9Q0XBQ3_9SAUR|nr:hypothetical protein JRQ81_009441 [Phrynocephalus forsythii]
MAPGSSPVRLGCALLLVLVVLCSPLLAQIGGLGARHEISVSNPDARKSAASAVDAYNRDSNSPNYYKLLRIVKAEMQVSYVARHCDVGPQVWFLDRHVTKCGSLRMGLRLPSLGHILARNRRDASGLGSAPSLQDWLKEGS